MSDDEYEHEFPIVHGEPVGWRQGVPAGRPFQSWWLLAEGYGEWSICYNIPEESGAEATPRNWMIICNG